MHLKKGDDETYFGTVYFMLLQEPFSTFDLLHIYSTFNPIVM